MICAARLFQTWNVPRNIRPMFFGILFRGLQDVELLDSLAGCWIAVEHNGVGRFALAGKVDRLKKLGGRFSSPLCTFPKRPLSSNDVPVCIFQRHEVFHDIISQIDVIPDLSVAYLAPGFSRCSQPGDLMDDPGNPHRGEEECPYDSE